MRIATEIDVPELKTRIDKDGDSVYPPEVSLEELPQKVLLDALYKMGIVIYVEPFDLYHKLGIAANINFFGENRREKNAQI